MYSPQLKEALAFGRPPGQIAPGAFTQVPAYSPADYHRVQESIRDVLSELQQVAPALSDTHRQEIAYMVGISGTGYESHDSFDVDQVTSQYALVKKIRSMVLDPQNNFHERTDAKALSALINAINGTITLFFKNQEKIDNLKEMRNMREAVITAVKDLPAEAQETFFKRLEELRDS